VTAISIQLEGKAGIQRSAIGQASYVDEAFNATGLVHAAASRTFASSGFGHGVGRIISKAFSDDRFCLPCHAGNAHGGQGGKRSTRRVVGIMALSGKSAEFGEVVVIGAPSEDHDNLNGNVHGGYAATMLGTAIGLAVHTTLPPSASYVTVDLKVTYLRPMTKESGPVQARGKVIHAGSRIVAFEGWLTNKEGQLCPYGTATCMIMAAKTDLASSSGGKLEV